MFLRLFLTCAFWTLLAAAKLVGSHRQNGGEISVHDLVLVLLELVAVSSVLDHVSVLIVSCFSLSLGFVGHLSSFFTVLIIELVNDFIEVDSDTVFLSEFFGSFSSFFQFCLSTVLGLVEFTLL